MKHKPYLTHKYFFPTLFLQQSWEKSIWCTFFLQGLHLQRIKAWLHRPYLQPSKSLTSHPALAVSLSSLCIWKKKKKKCIVWVIHHLGKTSRLVVTYWGNPEPSLAEGSCAWLVAGRSRVSSHLFLPRFVLVCTHTAPLAVHKSSCTFTEACIPPKYNHMNVHAYFQK